MIAHIDDLVVVGCLKDVQDVCRGLAGTFEMKCTYAGPKTGTIKLSTWARRIVFTENGMEIHGVPKHAAILLKEIGMEMCKSVSSPHIADTKLLDTLADVTRSYMPPTDAGRHRSAVARVVSLAQDRPDLDIVACTLAKTIAHPKIGDGWLVKRVCRYIKGRPRCAQSCEYQSEAQKLVVQTDMLRHGVGQLKHLATRTMWAQQIFNRKCTDLTCRAFCRLSRVSQPVSRSLSRSRSNGRNVAWSAVGRLCWIFL